LVVASFIDREPDVEQLGEIMALPDDHVAEHIAFGYVSIVARDQATWGVI
jgi:hypothetical protein